MSKTDPGDRIGVSIPRTHWIRPVVIAGFVLTVLMVTVSLFAAVLFLAPSVSRLTEASKRGAAERDELIAKIDQLQRDAVEEQQVQDCLQLYEDDVEEAKGVSQIALAELFAAAAQRMPPANAVEQAATVEDNRRLADELNAANDPLRDALAQLAGYRAIQPPPLDCPHPRGTP